MDCCKVHFETLGCRLNQVESEGAAHFFADAGFAVSMEPFSASSFDDDVVLCVVNTCTVTTKAEQKARRVIRMLLSVCPECAVVVTGCYAQLNRDEILAIDKRVCVLGGQQKSMLAELPEFVRNLVSAGDEHLPGNVIASRIQEFFDGKSIPAGKNVIVEPFRLSTDSFLSHSRASLKIQDGCNCSCTYCRIRLARGTSVSLDAQTVLERVQQLERAGYNEVVITTVNISQYRGAWNDRTVDFAGLLALVLAGTSSIGIRISSLYPEIVDERLAGIFANPRVRPHFHISVQSGSDAVLARMKRPYKSEAVYRACRLLRKAKENPFLACDIIAGFPGETEDDFEHTMNMLSECGFTCVHAFPFSPRPGTEAFSMRPMVPNYVTDRRIARLEEFSRNRKRAYIESFAGKTIPAVCESVHRAHVIKDRVVIHAVTENFLHCQLVFGRGHSDVPAAGAAIQVRVVRPLAQSERTGESDTRAEYVHSDGNDKNNAHSTKST